MVEERTKIKKVKSGTVDIVWNGVFARMEFNCNCLDALKLCHGMCCRLRAGYSVELNEEECQRLENRPHPTRPEIRILAAKPNQLECLYLDAKTSKCTIHDTRPQMCRKWHCSPDGQLGDPEIEKRDAGWMLMPIRMEEVQAAKQQGE